MQKSIFRKHISIISRFPVTEVNQIDFIVSMLKIEMIRNKDFDKI